jgi:LDH2 family malate/lactate/ureidoglycolate dehydrogenase
LLRQKLGKPLDPKYRIDRDGNPTTNPAEAYRCPLPGAPSRYGIALAVHLFGISAAARL